MLILSKGDERNMCYDSDTGFLASDPVRLKKLDKIKNNHSYYAGYYLHIIEGNMYSKYDVTLE